MESVLSAFGREKKSDNLRPKSAQTRTASARSITAVALSDKAADAAFGLSLRTDDYEAYRDNHQTF